jgi:hypothetical protein
MQVVEDEHEWMVLCRTIQEGRDSIEETESGLLGVLETQRQWQVWQPFSYLGREGSDICCPGTHLGMQLRTIPCADIGPDNLDPEPVGCGSRALVATPPESQSAALFSVRHEFPGGAGFADAWLASQQHQASPTSQRVLQGRLQHPHLRLPPYEYSVSKAIR